MGALLLNPNAHIFAILSKMTAHFGKEWLAWEPETVYQEISRVFGINPKIIPDKTKDKMGALQVLFSGDDFWHDWVVFEKVAHAVSNSQVDFTMTDELSPGQCALAFDIGTRIRPNDDFSNEIYGYVAASLHQNGIVFAPKSLFISANSLLSGLTRDVDPSLLKKVKRLWPQLDSLQILDMNQIGDENPEILQLSRLMVVKNYLNVMNKRLLEQLDE